ncbi:GNAT family N-acetyltransferase [Brevibacillus fluminis]|uniref:GNAT family N-acetyltransferase n=1 Tax=Brevibacillus fluminis TaxID=511487 RepID=UPI003F8B7B09
MYKQVRTASELAIFYSIVDFVWAEKSYARERFEGTDKFLLQAEDGEWGAVLEASPLEKSDPIIRELFSPYIRDLSVVDIPTIAVLPQYRGSLGTKAISLSVKYCEEHGYEHVISVNNPVFFRALKITYKMPLTRIDQAINYKGSPFIPAILHISRIYRNKSDYPWLFYPQEINEKRRLPRWTVIS